jgi:hypothetical protein
MEELRIFFHKTKNIKIWSCLSKLKFKSDRIQSLYSRARKYFKKLQSVNNFRTFSLLENLLVLFYLTTIKRSQ